MSEGEIIAILLSREFEERQETGKDITKDDIVNLTISLGQADSVEEFINLI